MNAKEQYIRQVKKALTVPRARRTRSCAIYRRPSIPRSGTARPSRT